MGFDLASAKPVAPAGGFDLASARPVAAPAGAGGIPVDRMPEADAVMISETDPNTGKKSSRLQQPSGTAPRKSAAQRQADLDRARELATPERTWRDDNALGVVAGPVDALLGLGSAMATPLVAVPGGFVKSLFNGKTPEKNASDIAERIAYKPATGTGAQLLRGASEVLSPLAAIAPGDINALAVGAGSAATSVRGLARANAGALAAEEAAQVAGAPKVMDLIRKPKDPALSGVGAARSPAETLRVEAAKQLPVPMDRLMTKGMRTRAKPDIQFEQIAAKDPELGAGLRNRTVQVNQAALDNFDAFAEATGAQGSGLRPTGKVVNDYLIKRVENAKKEIRQAYNDAAESVEGKTPADLAPLRAFLEKHAAEAETGNAPVLNAVERAIQKLDPENTGKIPLKEFNEIRELVGRVSKDGTPNAPYRKPLQTLVDDAVETNGGPLYRTARRQYENYQNEFKNAGAIDRLLRAKPGTKDRTVALEDVVTKSTLDAPSTDAVRQVKTTLTRKQDAEGLQAWKEVQGEAARQMKERVLGEGRLEGGAREVLPGKLSKLVREMDADGRLEVIFSKQGAQQWRDLADTVSEMKTIPPGTVSSSGTAEVLAGLLDTAVSGSTGLPLPVASALNYGVKRYKKGQKLKKIDAALNPDGEK